ncbi:hypothetical protein THAOC_03182 [Thalassiosira oceanica]|uniref:Uncharacterized protein n=1 Tax=Thalassiosira oceanica TaxID=159749 RepID=K0TCD3_THAOC|nr:hypothetical protein THAOC_03182 [Thalassiosira oceanica]|eukprot:EJK75110.1 hypothetical protein THAOC_03182 [Thalassiosira oceanica]
MAEQSIKICILGESGVGKSSLALRFVSDEFKAYTESTIGASFMSKQVTLPSTENDERERLVSLKLWDTAGQEKYRSLAPMYYRGSDAAVLVYDITKTFEELRGWVYELKNNGPPGLALVVCGNKSDLKEDRLVGPLKGEDYARTIGALYIECSAKTAHNVDKMFSEIASRVPPKMDDCLLEENVDLGKRKNESSGCC